MISRCGPSLIQLSDAQIAAFAGNAIELQGRDAPLLALSRTAFDVLEAAQIAQIEQSAMLLPLAIPTIERAGGSVRCTIADIHLKPRSHPIDALPLNAQE